MSAWLDDVDKAIVNRTLDGITPAEVPALRTIHEAALRELRPQLDAVRRAIAMRERALGELDRIERGAPPVWSRDGIPVSSHDGTEVDR